MTPALLFSADRRGIHFEPISTWAPEFVSAIRRHYTGSSGAPPGKKLAWRIYEHGRLVGWIGLGEPPFKLSPRRRLGLQDARPALHTVCCYIYRLERERERESTASAILRSWEPVASQDWRTRYGWAPVHWETLVSQGAAGNLGACFRRAGYRSLGWTTGRTARRPAGHSRGPRVWGDGPPRLVLYRGPLFRMPLGVQEVRRCEPTFRAPCDVTRGTIAGTCR